MEDKDEFTRAVILKAELHGRNSLTTYEKAVLYAWESKITPKQRREAYPSPTTKYAPHDSPRERRRRIRRGEGR